MPIERVRVTATDTQKIAKIEDMHCDAGWRDFSFLKITTDDGIVGQQLFAGEATRLAYLGDRVDRPVRVFILLELLGIRANRAEEPRMLQRHGRLLRGSLTLP